MPVAKELLVCDVIRYLSHSGVQAAAELAPLPASMLTLSYHSLHGNAELL